MQVQENIKKFINDNLEVKVSVLPGDKPKVVRNLQHLFAKKFEDKREQIFYQVLLEHFVKAEKECPTAGKLFLELFLGKRLSNQHGSCFTGIDIQNFLVANLGISKTNSEIVLQAARLASVGSKISIKKSANAKTIIELIEGYSFQSKRQIKSQVQVFKSPRVVCIDGFIENISEIHHLLEHLSETKDVLILFSRGMSDDVLHTIKINVDRGTIRICPILIPFEIENINSLVDIAVVSGGDVISHLKGDLISSIDFSKLPKIDYVIINDNFFIIKNSSSKISVELHRKNLLKSLEEKPEVEQLLMQRIRSLTSSYVEISVADDINFISNSQQVDEGIRFVMSLINSKNDPINVAQHFYRSFENVTKSSSIF